MYPSNILSKEAFEILQSEQKSYLIDVRTEYEWENIGVPNLEKLKKSVLFISWPIIIDFVFINNLNKILKSNFKFDDKLLFICRSGSRSRLACEIAFNNDFKYCYNIIDGFEGSYNENAKIGWKSQNLPWTHKKVKHH
tara:strand:+ start:5526 stop:5939 length:414 start_codon:yes stop_codon:yes gene_type:complete